MAHTRIIHNVFLRRNKSISNKRYYVMVIMIALVRSTMPGSVFEAMPDPFSKKEECGLSRKEQEDIVYLHRKLRKEDCGANMMPFRGWNDATAKFVYNHAKKCEFTYPKELTAVTFFNGFNPDRMMNSIAANVDKNKDFNYTIEHIWYRPQKKKYCYGNMTKKSLEEFGDYAQIVWSTTDHIGCGRYWCDSLKGFEGGKAAWFDVCKYTIGMMTFPHMGRYDFVPFKKGKPCSECPIGFDTCCDGTCWQNTGLGCPKGTQKGVGDVQCEESKAEDCAGGNGRNGENGGNGGNGENGGNGGNGRNDGDEAGDKDASRAPGLKGVYESLVLLPLVTAGTALLMMG